MSIRHRIDPFTAQRLLRGEPAGPDRLAEVLAMAAAPAAREELAGEEAVVTAFREAHLDPAVQQRRESVLKSALSKLLTVKVAAVALTVTATGGVALAAGAGHLPKSLGNATPTVQPAPSRAAGAGHSPKATAGHDEHHSATPSPSLVGLCHAYQAGAGDNPGKALDSPAFTHLITVAGRKDKVAAYCTALLRTRTGKAHATHSSGHAATHPTAEPHAHRTGAPSTHPTGAPTTHPSKPARPVH